MEAESKSDVGVMADSVCQLDCAMGAQIVVRPDPGRVWVGLAFGSVDRLKQIFLPHVGGPHPIN